MTNKRPQPEEIIIIAAALLAKVYVIFEPSVAG